VNLALEHGISLSESLLFTQERLKARLKASSLSQGTKSLVLQTSREYLRNALTRLDSPKECFKDFSTDIFVMCLSLSNIPLNTSEDLVRLHHPITTINDLIKALEALERKEN
jgi:hypothetical protein